jgi:hypothetical protein
MIRTIITPEKQDISIHVPKDYVGKQIEVLMYDLEELNQNSTPDKRQPSEFRGQLNLSDEQYNDLQSHIKNVRNEWDRNI